MKRVYKIVVTTALCAVIISVCVVPAYADFVTDVLWGIIEWSVTPESTWEDEDLAVMLRKMWPTSVAGGQIEITYDELQSLCTSLNMTGYPCHISRSNTSYAIVGDGNVVGLGFTFSIDGRFCANSEGYVFVAPTNTNLVTVVQTIENMVQNIYDRLDTLTDTLAMQDNLEEWLKLFHAQIEVVQLRQELVNLQLDELIEAVSSISISADGGTILFNTQPITDKLDELITVLQTSSGSGGSHLDIVEAIELYHQDFNEYFSQFGDSIDYASYDVTLSGQSLYEWDTGAQSYEGGTLTDGSTVTVVRVPELSDTHTGQNTAPYVEFSSAGYPRILPGASAFLPYGLRLFYDGAVREISFAGTSGSGVAMGSEVVLEDCGSDPMRVTYYGKTTQAGTPSASAPVPLVDVTGEYLDLIYTDGGSQTAHLAAPMPGGGLRGLQVDSGGNYTDANGQSWVADEVDGSTGLFTRRIGSVVFDGSSDENWLLIGSGSTHYFRNPFLPMGSVQEHGEVSSLLPFTTITTSTTAVGFDIYNSKTADAACICLRYGGSVDTVAELRAALAAKPMTVYYALTSPVSEQLSLPGTVEYPAVGNTFPGYTEAHEANGAQLKVVYTTRNPIVELYSDASGDWRWKYGDGSSRTVTDPSVLYVLQDAFHTRTYTSGDLIVFNDGLNSVHVSGGGSLNFRVMQGSKIVVWFVNWQHSSRDWLDQKLDSLQITSGGGSDLAPVIDRMDTIIENLGAEVGVAGCEHVYVSEIHQDPTCALPGLQTFTCENCGSSYSEILESLGHDWLCTGRVEEELDPETGETVSSGYDVYTCSRCDDSYNDYEGSGAPAAENTSLTGIVSRVFEKIGSLVGELLAMVIRLLDKLLVGFDEIVTSFNEKTQQIVSFGSGYTAWLSGFWDIVPSDLQLVLGFCLTVICLGIIGKKIVFAS